jgi:hypothetical protein
LNIAVGIVVALFVVDVFIAGAMNKSNDIKSKRHAFLEGE